MNMAFSMTTPQMYACTQDVTRRSGVRTYVPGQVLWAVEKGQGIPKGGHVVRIGQIEVISFRLERLSRLILEPEYGVAEVKREGFDCTPQEFVTMYCLANKCRPDDVVDRIEFKHLYAPRPDAEPTQEEGLLT